MKSIYLFLFIILIFDCNTPKKVNDHNHSVHDNHSHENHSHETANTIIKANDYFGNYTLKDAKYGTNTTVTIKNDTRTMVTNALPNHKTGNFPNQGNPNTIKAQKIIRQFPLNPVYIGTPEWVREPGVALNGVKFEPGTAEVVICDTGENYRVEAFQNIIDLGLDFNNAHVQPTGAYHYHGIPTSIIEKFYTGDDLVHIGFAMDGFAMYYSKSGKYKSSYKLLNGNRAGEDCTYTNPHNERSIAVDGHHDGTYGSDFEFIKNYGDLDACNGITINGNYFYIVTNSYPYVSRCLMGEVIKTKNNGFPSGQQHGKRPRRERPSVSEVLKHMDTNNDGKISIKEAKEPLKEDFYKLDENNDGFITKTEIEKGASGQHNIGAGRPPRRN